MAKRRRKQQDPSDELEAAINDTSEERSSKKDKGATSKRPKGRRAARMAKFEEERKQRQKRLVLMSVAIAAVVIVASLGAWYILKPEDTSNPIVVMETNHGTFEIELFMDECPITAGNFKELTEKGFYDDLVFHRIIENFMIQSGDPNGDGTGGPGYSIEGEASALDLKHNYGSISMANSGSPDTAGSQFFIVTNPDGTPDLDGSYAVFGKVVSGMDVVDRISRQPVRDNGQGEQSSPINPVLLQRVYIK
jgi:cyclophilin family peptidyl-prolyl cis-trans isomerase